MSSRGSVTVLLVYESMFGNTGRAAQAVAQGLQEGGASVEVSEVGAAPTRLPDELDLLVLGAPTHAFSLSRPKTRADAVQQGAPAAVADGPGIREWIAGLELGGHRQVPVAAFDTRASAVKRLPLAAGPAIVRLARHRGMTPFGRPLALLVDGFKGPLAEGELARARSFGTGLAARLRESRVVG